MSQIARIRSIIGTFGENGLITIGKIALRTGFPKPSVRRVLSYLNSRGEIERIERGLYSPRIGGQVDVWYQKFIGTQKYRGNPRQFYAITFEKNDIDREEELLDALDDYLGRRGYIDGAGNTGYASDKIKRPDISFNAIYPKIETGEL